MQANIITKPAFTVVGLRIHAKAMSPEIPALWGQFAPRIDQVPHLAEPHVSYGMMDNFNEAASELDYMAGVSVTNADALPTGMTVWNVPAATYVVFETTIPTIGETMWKVHSEWFPASGYRQAPGPYFERYGETFNPNDPTSKISIYMPVEKKA